MRTKTPLSREEHEALAIVLQQIQETLVTMSVRVGNAGPMTSRAFRGVERLRKALDVCRSALDDDQYRMIGDTVRYFGRRDVAPLLPKTFGRPEGS